MCHEGCPLWVYLGRLKVSDGLKPLRHTVCCALSGICIQYCGKGFGLKLRCYFRSIFLSCINFSASFVAPWVLRWLVSKYIGRPSMVLFAGI